jgi:hypothetical protein
MAIAIVIQVCVTVEGGGVDQRPGAERIFETIQSASIVHVLGNGEGTVRVEKVWSCVAGSSPPIGFFFEERPDVVPR